MISLQEWRKYVNNQIDEIVARKKKAQEKEEKPKGVVTKKIDFSKSFGLKKETTKETKVETKKEDLKSLPKSFEGASSVTKLPSSSVDPIKILAQRDKKPKSVPPPKIEEAPLVDPAKILVQKDKKQVSVDEQKRMDFPSMPQPEQKELPLPEEVKLEDRRVKEERVTQKTLQKREELIRRLLDPLVSLEEAALLLNVSKATVRRYADNRLLSHIRTAGGQRRFRLSDILTFVEKREKRKKEEKVEGKLKISKEDESLAKLKEQQERLKEIEQIDLKEVNSEYNLSIKPAEGEKIVEEKEDKDKNDN